MKRIGLVDTTFRDAQQCLWASRMSTAMMTTLDFHSAVVSDRDFITSDIHT